MATPITVTLDLPKDLLLALGQAAKVAHSSPSDYLRAVLRTALESSPARLRAEEETVRLSITLASDWLDLQRRLRGAGYVLRLSATGELRLHSWPRDRPILPIADLGHSLPGLVLRFGAAFPGDVPSECRATPRKGRAA